ncbi:MAG TPA: riboflavin synthase [Thermoanaerobaculia bacterium]|nr:riboflavin synthase [Thermoanaerobaculia bacterium]
MFTGLVRERGRVATAPQPSGEGGRRLTLAHGEELSAELSPGASLAVSGVCLTAVALRPGVTTVDLAPETLSRTTLGELEAGEEVNLEPPLRAGDPLGGHFVQGHVDGTISVLAVEELGAGHREVTLQLPSSLALYVVEKGSVALDGVSLTVARLDRESFRVALIPHTLAVTTLARWRPGRRVNLEVDVLAKYVRQAVRPFSEGG